MKTYSASMKKTILRILKSRQKLDDFLTLDEFHLRIEKENYLPLVIEKHESKIMITHYREENGDLISDPDMVYELGIDGNWHVVSLQLWNGHYSLARWNENGKTYIKPKLTRELVSFSAMWARNLSHQDWG